MSDRALIITGFAALFVSAVGTIVFAYLYRNRVATPGELVNYLLCRHVTRFVVVGVWAWSGWHFLAR